MSCPDCIRLRHERDAAVERVRQLELAAGHGDLTLSLQERFGIARLHARMLAVLMERPDASKALLMDIFYGADPNGGPLTGDKILSVLVCNLRKKLRPYGVHITTHTKSGWSLSPDVKAKVRELIGGAS